MAENYLITGYWGEPHVTAENDRGINAAIFGKGRFVLPVGEQFRAEYIGNNTVRIYDGKLLNNGAAAGIPAGEYVDIQIANASQGMKRNDLIVFQYQQDASTLVESGTFVVVHGTETTGTPADPTLEEEDLLSGVATFDQMPLWRVSVSGTTIAAPVQMFSVSKSILGVQSFPAPALNSEKKLKESGYYHIQAICFNGVRMDFGVIYWDGSSIVQTAMALSGDAYAGSTNTDNTKFCKILSDGSLNLYTFTGYNYSFNYSDYTEDTAFYTAKIG